MPKIEHIYLSPGHNFFGHYGREPSRHAMEEVPEAVCVAGQGLQGDRFFGFKENYKGQITFFAAEVHEAMLAELALANLPSSVYRRNVITRGADLNAWIGKEFCLQGIWFEGTEEAAPCDWMNQAVGSGARELLRGRGGLRARILTDGTLRADG